MSQWLFTLRERFRPGISAGWDKYLSFSQFAHIRELVTLDSIMCPQVITELCDEDWNHNVHEDYRTHLFRNADYLLTRPPVDPRRRQVLAIRERPDGAEAVPPGFARCGFDIVDAFNDISCLTNCGPIPEAFAPSQVNDYGLLPDVETARAVRDAMRRLQPEDPHLGQCEVWLIARHNPIGP